MRNNLLAALLLALPGIAGAMMSGPMMTTSYFPLVDGARYDYALAGGSHATATAVMHAGQTWAGTGSLVAMHTTFTCADGVASCPMDMDDFYDMGPDGVHWYGGASQGPDGTHAMMSLVAPDLALKNPVSPGTMMGGGAYQGVDQWQSMVAGMSTTMGTVSAGTMHQAMALETVATPAGTFENCLHVHEKRADGTERDVWYAANVGMVMWRSGGEEARLSRMTMPAGPAPKVGYAVEYYHAGLDHYFVTAGAAEIAALDAGTLTGWRRTGMGFHVVDAADASALPSQPVCRFYGRPEYGLDTHFYSASPDECAAVQQKWPAQWMLESSAVFRMAMPDASGACPDGTQPVYRTWNGRADSNHRFTTDPAVQRMMMGRGGVAEGSGAFPVGMCAPL